MSSRAVQFQEERNDTHLFSLDESVRSDELWYRPDEYAEMKARSKTEAKQFRHAGFGKLLDGTFLSPRPDAQACINSLCLLDAAGPSRRGLERFLSRQHFDERASLKERVRFMVLARQGELREQGQKQDEIDQALSTLYITIGRAAKVFARRLGKADELAVRSQDAQQQPAEQQQQEPERKSLKSKKQREDSFCSVASHSSLDSRRLPPQRRLAPRMMRAPAARGRQGAEFYAQIA